MRYRKAILFIVFFTLLLTSLLPVNIYIMVVFSVMVWIMLPFSKGWDGGTIALLLFSVFYTVMILLGGYRDSNFLVLSYLFAPVAFYRWGQFMVCEYIDEKIRYRLIFFFVLAY